MYQRRVDFNYGLELGLVWVELLCTDETAQDGAGLPSRLGIDALSTFQSYNFWLVLASAVLAKSPGAQRIQENSLQIREGREQGARSRPRMFGRPFVKRFALCYRSVVLSVRLSVCNVRALWPNGWTDQDDTWHSGRPRPWPHCVRWGPSSPSPKGAQLPQFSAHISCGQMTS